MIQDTNQPTPISNVQSPKKDYTMWFVVGGGVAFLLIVATGLVVGYNMIQAAMKKIPAPVSQTPEVVTTPTIVVTPSQWATDAGVLKLRDDLKVLSGKIDSVDLFEPQIAPPTIDLGLVIK